MKKIAFLVLIILPIVLYIGMGHAVSKTDENMVDYVLRLQSEDSNIKKIEDNIKRNVNNDIAEFLPEFNPESIITELVKGKFSLNLKDISAGILNYLTRSMKIQIDILVKLVALAFIFAIIKNLQDSFMSENIKELASFTCYSAMIAIIAVSFKEVLQLARDILDGIDKFINFVMPSLIALLVSSGNFVSGAAFKPLMIFSLQVGCRVLKDILLPLTFMSGVLFIVDGMSKRIKINKLARLFRQVTLWGLGIFLTIYISIIAIQGIAGGVTDGVATKTTKFALSTFIPVAGKYLSDAADTVIGCALIVKNAAGVAVMIAMIAITLIPILKILAIMLMYKLAGVIIEPVVEDRVSDCLNEVSESITVILGIVAGALFMFILSVAAVIGAGSISAMMQ